MPLADIEIQKIHNGTEPDAVHKVAHGSAEHHAKPPEAAVLIDQPARCAERASMKITPAETSVAAKNSQNCHSMSDRLRNPNAAPRLRIFTKSKKPGMTVTAP